MIEPTASSIWTIGNHVRFIFAWRGIEKFHLFLCRKKMIDGFSDYSTMFNFSISYLVFYLFIEFKK